MSTYEITLTNTNPLSFTAHLSRTYLLSNDYTNDFIDDLSDLTISGIDQIVYEFNIHDNCLNYFIPANSIGGTDFIDDYDDAISAFGTPIIDFIDSHCKLNNIPFYPNR
jgi:hypothetical protein